MKTKTKKANVGRPKVKDPKTQFSITVKKSLISSKEKRNTLRKKITEKLEDGTLLT